ncbi:hypothetical protein [Streptomyces sioyaensis]|uniref:hypothetical protein n=1 Tax=Streptomyces sioyaensis TaxID=67364 RepID=UPI00379D7AC7
MTIAHKTPVHPISRSLWGNARFAMPVAAIAAVTAPSAAYAIQELFEGDRDLLSVRPVSDSSLTLTAEVRDGNTVFALRPLAGNAEQLRSGEALLTGDLATQGFQNIYNEAEEL